MVYRPNPIIKKVTVINEFLQVDFRNLESDYRFRFNDGLNLRNLCSYVNIASHCQQSEASAKKFGNVELLSLRNTPSSHSCHHSLAEASSLGRVSKSPFRKKVNFVL